MTEENYIEKPEGKPVKAYRARVKLYGNDVFVVNPEEPRESNRAEGQIFFLQERGRKGQQLFYPHQCGCE